MLKNRQSVARGWEEEEGESSFYCRPTERGQKRGGRLRPVSHDPLFLPRKRMGHVTDPFATDVPTDGHNKSTPTETFNNTCYPRTFFLKTVSYFPISCTTDVFGCQSTSTSFKIKRVGYVWQPTNINMELSIWTIASNPRWFAIRLRPIRFPWKKRNGRKRRPRRRMAAIVRVSVDVHFIYWS